MAISRLLKLGRRDAFVRSKVHAATFSDSEFPIRIISNIFAAPFGLAASQAGLLVYPVRDAALYALRGAAAVVGWRGYVHGPTQPSRARWWSQRFFQS